MNTKLNVLIVEDEVDDALLIEKELRRGGFDPRCMRVDTAGAMNGALVGGSWDVIICDYTLPKFSGVQALDYLHRAGLDIPFIVVSGTISEETAVAAMKAGAHDYIMKGNLARLVPAVQREVHEAGERRARREAEEKLKQTERLRTIGELVASLIHDLNNPLQAILGLAELLKNSQLPSDRRTKHADMIAREVEHIIDMRNDFLEFTRGEVRISRNPVNVADVVSEIIDTYGPLYADSGITLTCSKSPDKGVAPIIEGDTVRVWRVLHNLIANAKDAMPSGGRISIAVDATTEHVLVEVVDNGSGIPGEIRSHIFSPFVTCGKPDGTGLGLAIVKHIVEAHGGSVTFDSEECVGTTFRLSFPRQMSQPSGHRAASAQRVPTTAE